jgi:tetratricopeptide (TPR) repeat protein
MLKSLATSPRLLAGLVSHFNPSKSRFRIITFLLAFAGVVLAIMNPRVATEKAEVPMEGSQVMLAIDVSNSMLANDVAPNRLERAKTFAVKLTDALGGNRIGVLAFAGEARLQMPPSADLGAVKQAIQTLGTKSIPIQGTNIEAALEVARQSLSADALAYSAVAIITDGEELEGAALQQARTLGRTGMAIFVAGLGTEEGALLSDPESGQPILDENDLQVLSKANPALLKDLAEAAGGSYVQVADIGKAVTEMAGDLSKIGKRTMANNNLVNFYSFAPWILILVLLLLLWDWVDAFRFALPSKKQGMAAIITIGLICQFNPAFSQKANAKLKEAFSAYKAGQFENAALAYEQALELDPANTEARFYLGLVAYKSGQYEEAAKQFTELAARNPSGGILAASLNNAGLSFAKADKLPEAVNAFKQALKSDPADAEIRRNLQKAILELKARQEKQDPENQQSQPPMDKEDAERKLQSLMDDERRTREKMKPRPLGGSSGKSW